MSPTRFRLLLNTAAMGSIAIAGSGAANAADATFVPMEQQSAPAQVDLIESSRLGCVPSLTTPLPAASVQCEFDTATRGARIAAR